MWSRVSKAISLENKEYELARLLRTKFCAAETLFDFLQHRLPDSYLSTGRRAIHDYVARFPVDDLSTTHDVLLKNLSRDREAVEPLAVLLRGFALSYKDDALFDYFAAASYVLSESRLKRNNGGKETTTVNSSSDLLNIVANLLPKVESQRTLQSRESTVPILPDYYVRLSPAEDTKVHKDIIKKFNEQPWDQWEISIHYEIGCALNKSQIYDIGLVCSGGNIDTAKLRELLSVYATSLRTGQVVTEHPSGIEPCRSSLNTSSRPHITEIIMTAPRGENPTQMKPRLYRRLFTRVGHLISSRKRSSTI